MTFELSKYSEYEIELLEEFAQTFFEYLQEECNHKCVECPTAKLCDDIDDLLLKISQLDKSQKI